MGLAVFKRVLLPLSLVMICRTLLGITTTSSTWAFCQHEIIIHIKSSRHQPFSLIRKSPSIEKIESTRMRDMALFEKRTGKVKGVYSRPSAAIERGSGFYIPGLEGYRVRILSGVVVLALSYLNSVLSSETILSEGVQSSNLQLSMNLANGYGILLLFQALVDLGKETLFSNEGKPTKTKPASIDMDQIISPSLVSDENFSETVQWAAATFLSLTSAQNILLVNESGVLYNLGQNTVNTIPDGGIKAVLETLQKSKSGRVAVPSDHPSAVLVDAQFRRCVLLQRVNEQMAFVVGSDQLLQSYTKSDLKWLGNLSKLLNSDS